MTQNGSREINPHGGTETQRKAQSLQIAPLCLCAFVRGFCQKSFIFCLIFLLLPACSRADEQTLEKTVEVIEEQPTVIQEPKIVEPWFTLIPEKARPGEPVTVGYCDNFKEKNLKGLQAVLLSPDGKRLTKAAFFCLPEEEGEPELRAAILAVPSTTTPGELSILIESSGGMITILPIDIEPREFPSETIHLNQQNTDLRTVPDPQKTAESEQLWAILSRTGTDVYSGDAFLFPVNSNRRTSHYGDRRVYLYSGGSSDTTIHAGIDIGVPTGTEVRACAAGKVVLARMRIVTGNTVVIEHLPGLYSLYYHMDKISVPEGITVEAGFPLGESGSTGLATGPHLHWEIRVSTENADPDAFLTRPILDKKAIMDRIGNN